MKLVVQGYYPGKFVVGVGLNTNNVYTQNDGHQLLGKSIYVIWLDLFVLTIYFIFKKWKLFDDETWQAIPDQNYRWH